ncbi:MAG: Tex family protein [Deltaproteobacteria bacterium]|nr:Tex family protein [Deltaproteobacteria bacterium]
MQKTFESWFAEQAPQIPARSAAAVLKLAEEGGTVPFIARYRKEQTGNLDEVGVRQVLECKERWEEIVKRQAFILQEIEHQKKLTPELKAKIEGAYDLSLLEDLYLPYKQKRKTKAAIAKEAGLEPLADWLWDAAHGLVKLAPGETPESKAAAFLNAEKEIDTTQKALGGATDIVTERLSEDVGLRQEVRETYHKEALVRSRKGAKVKPHSKFELYFDHQEPVPSLMKPESSHRYLAMRRGWMEEELVLSLGGELPPVDPAAGDDVLSRLRVPDPLVDQVVARFEAAALTVPDFPGATIMKTAARLAARAHVIPAIENEVHKALRDIADEAAISVFAENVRKLLLAAPFGAKAVLGVDPGIRTGCKLAMVDSSGAYVGNAVMHLETDRGKQEAKMLLAKLVEAGGVQAVAVGNGTAGRETEEFVREALKEAGSNTPVVMVSESGASIYSASDVAREEFPDLDLTVRGAISIARRLQDPLAELVKVDPKSIGVGQYQHDVSPTALKKSLDAVVDSCVNQVGVNLNTASTHLLQHVSGIGPGLAKSIVSHRGKVGLFKSRHELLEVPRFTQKTYEQAAGFLRIPGGDNPLDNTGVHPERYHSLQRLAERMNVGVQGLLGSGVASVKQSKELKDELGEFTFADIIAELEKPGRDPRDGFVSFAYRSDIHEIKDLEIGMVCPGIVTNVTNFGAFVDIGVHQDGLVHISQLADKFVKDPREVVSPGDRVQVRVVEIDKDKKRIALTMRSDGVANMGKPRPPASDARPGHGAGQGRNDRHDRNDRNDRSSGGFGGGRPATPNRGPAQPFNNPFANLASGNRDKR